MKSAFFLENGAALTQNRGLAVPTCQRGIVRILGEFFVYLWAMINLGYNNRWVRLIKDVLFVALCCWILTRKSVLAVIVGAMGLVWYGRDAWYQAKALWQEKTYKAPPRQQEESPITQAPADDKITVTDLTDAKEVDFEKE